MVNFSDENEKCVIRHGEKRLFLLLSDRILG